MISAATTPTATEAPRVGRSELVIDWPSTDTCTSGPSADSAVVMRWSASAVVMLADWVSQVTLANAMVSSRLICPAPSAA